MTIGERIRRVRERLGLNQAEFARRLKTGQPVISRYERNQRVPDADFLRKLNVIFHVNINWLLTGTGNMFSEDRPLEPRVVPLEDAPLVSMIAYIKEVWERGDQKERAWLEIQFSKCFPDFVEWRRMREEEREKKVVEVKED